MEVIMEFQKNVPLPKRPYVRKYAGMTARLIQAQHGDSLWFEDRQAAERVRALYLKAKKQGRAHLRVCLFKVGDEDPCGPGFRVWFLKPAWVEKVATDIGDEWQSGD